MKPIFKWTALVAVSCAVTSVVHPRVAHSSDHLDAPAVKADATTDINDLYSWMDGTNAVYALTVFPAAPSTAAFSDKVQYVIHTQSAATFGPTSNDFNIICTFTAATPPVASCWGGATEYVTGDASQAAGITSTSGKFKVFAGLRADPFFFNLDGFKNTVTQVENAIPALTTAGKFNEAGCPILDDGTANLLKFALSHSPDAGPAEDFFAPLNTLAIVVSIDKSLITNAGASALVASWASTNKVP